MGMVLATLKAVEQASAALAAMAVVVFVCVPKTPVMVPRMRPCSSLKIYCYAS